MGAVVDVCNKPGTAALHLLSLFDVSLSMRFPGRGGVLNDWSDSYEKLVGKKPVP